MAYAVMEDGEIKIDTVYEAAILSKMHWLSYSSGDYDDSDFYMLPGRLNPDIEFERYPEVQIVPVRVDLAAH